MHLNPYQLSQLLGLDLETTQKILTRTKKSRTIKKQKPLAKKWENTDCECYICGTKTTSEWRSIETTAGKTILACNADGLQIKAAQALRAKQANEEKELDTDPEMYETEQNPITTPATHANHTVHAQSHEELSQRHELQDEALALLSLSNSPNADTTTNQWESNNNNIINTSSLPTHQNFNSLSYDLTDMDNNINQNHQTQQNFNTTQQLVTKFFSYSPIISNLPPNPLSTSAFPIYAIPVTLPEQPTTLANNVTVSQHWQSSYSPIPNSYPNFDFPYIYPSQQPTFTQANNINYYNSSNTGPYYPDNFAVPLTYTQYTHPSPAPVPTYNGTNSTNFSTYPTHNPYTPFYSSQLNSQSRITPFPQSTNEPTNHQSAPPSQRYNHR